MFRVKMTLMPKREIVIQQFDTFDEADAANARYYLQLTPAERLRIALEMMQGAYATHPRLERIYRTAELGECTVSSDRWMGV